MKGVKDGKGKRKRMGKGGKGRVEGKVLGKRMKDG